MSYVQGSFARFIEKFLSDKSFRFRVLYTEVDELDKPEWGLLADQILAVRGLDAAEIVTLLRRHDLSGWEQKINQWERDWTQPLNQLQYEVYEAEVPSCDSLRATEAGPGILSAAAAAYTQGTAFFLNYKKDVSPGETIVIKGVNFGPEVWVCFVPCPDERDADKYVVKASKVEVDGDLYQHVTVTVPPSAGKWMMYAGYQNYSTLDAFKAKTQKRGRVTVG